MGKSSVIPIFKNYISTLHGRDDGVRFQDVAVQLALPAAAGVAVGILMPTGLRGPVAASLPVAITAISIVSAFMCAMAVMVFQLRIQVAEVFGEGKALAKKVEAGDLQLVDELFHDVMWSIVVGFASVFCMTASCFLVEAPEAAFRVAIGASVATLLNDVLVVGMCLKRMSASYAVVSKAWGR